MKVGAKTISHAQVTASQEPQAAQKPKAVQAPEAPVRSGYVQKAESPVLPEVSQKLDAALAYAAAGKPRLAAKRIREAKELFEPAQTQTAGLHPGLWKANPTQAAIEAAELSVSQLAQVTPIRANEIKPPKVVVIYGTSANPPTGDGGHAGIVRWGAKDLRVDIPNDKQPEKALENLAADEVWVLPVYKHAFSSKRDLIDFDHRFAMAKLGFEQLSGLEGKVKVRDTERAVVTEAFATAEKNGTKPEDVKVGTIDIVEKLMSEHPGTQFVLALGGDTYRDLLGGKWKRGNELLEKVQIAVVPRAGVDGIAGTEANAPKLSDISSTKVRGSNDLSFLKEVLHPDVLSYMQSHGLYAFAPPTESSSKEN